MSYPVVASTATAAPKSFGQRAGALALLAGGLYVLGYNLPAVDGGYGSGSLADGDSATAWAWLVPGLVAVVTGGLGMAGKRWVGQLAAGVALGLSGFTIYQLLVIDEFMSADINSSVLITSESSAGIGFWVLALAAIVGLLAGLVVISGIGSSGEAPDRSGGPLALLGGLCFVGVPLAVLLPENGFNPVSDLPTDSLKAGVLAWGILSPVIGFALAAGRKPSGVAFAAGVALAHCGFAVTTVQSEGEGLGVDTTGHVAIFQGTAAASLVLLMIALANAVKTASAVGTGATTPSASTPGQWAPDPFGRHQYRWYDGSHWTSQVSDSGVVGRDEPVSAPPPIPRDQWQPPHQ